MTGEGYSIASLIIDVRTPADTPVEYLGPPISSLFRFRRTVCFTGKRVVDPGYVANFLQGKVALLLNMGLLTFDLGAQLYEHIGEIVITKDGAHVHTFDLGAALMALDGSCPGASASKAAREAALAMWRPLCIAKRARLGLLEPFESVGAELGIDIDVPYVDYRACLSKCKNYG